VKGSGFKLEQVLNYRSEMEKMRKQEFASAKRDFEHADDRLRREKERVENLSEEFCHRQGELESIQEIRMYVDFFARKRVLKEQKAKEFKLMIEQKEQTFMDEISIQKMGNKL
jgi:flagellar FliJ protein